MNIKQFFFVSLIILSIAMGLNWLKHRPTKPVGSDNTSKKPRQALNFEDLQIKENEKEEEEEEEKEEKEEKENKEQANKKYEGEVTEEDDDENKEETSENPKTASETEEIIASETLIVANPLKDDPILQDFFKVERNPFETSPYAQLVEKLRIEAELASRPVVEEKKEVKVPKIMSHSRFNGTIETERGPKVIVDGNVYEKGNELNGCIIQEIRPNLIVLESDSDKWLLPKTGVKILINNQTGEFSVDDSYD